MSKKKILIIDDDIIICQSLQLLLQSEYDVQYFNDVTSSKNYLDTPGSHVDLLILDYNISHENGIEFYQEEIKHKNRQIPAILISGFIVTKLKSKEEMDELNALFVQVFEKPFEISEIIECIHSVLGN